MDIFKTFFMTKENIFICDYQNDESSPSDMLFLRSIKTYSGLFIDLTIMGGKKEDSLSVMLTPQKAYKLALEILNEVSKNTDFIYVLPENPF